MKKFIDRQIMLHFIFFYAAKSGRAKHSCGPRRPKSGPIASAAYALFAHRIRQQVALDEMQLSYMEVK